MEFKIRTTVEQSFSEADKTFSKEYLTELNPQFPPFSITHFEGIETGKEVHVVLNFFIFKQLWIYTITDKKDNDQEWSFVDEGKKTPFFLKYWHHKYQLINENGKLAIVDTVNFKTPFFLLDYFMYPWLYVHFLYRPPIYKKRFQKK